MKHTTYNPQGKTMKSIKIIVAVLALAMTFAGCSVFKGRPEKDNINQVRGSNVWMNERLDEEQDDQQLAGEFGDQAGGDANDERPQAIDLDRSPPDMNN
jgi:hypothetical protein